MSKYFFSTCKVTFKWFYVLTSNNQNFLNVIIYKNMFRVCGKELVITRVKFHATLQCEKGKMKK